MNPYWDRTAENVAWDELFSHCVNLITQHNESPLCGQQTEGERHLALHGSAEPGVTTQDSNSEKQRG